MQIHSLSLTVLLAIVGTACKRQPAPEEQAPAPPSLPPQAVAPATPKADTVGWGWDSPEAARLSGVRYAPPRQVFGTLGIPSGEYFDSLGPGYAIGSLVDGPYRGADIVSAERRTRSEEHTSELQSRLHLVCRLLLEKKKIFPRGPDKTQRLYVHLNFLDTAAYLNFP